MPQVPSRPPPYSVECSSFPPPVQAAAGSQAWAFQRAFESAREPIRWAILTTIRCWEDAWTFKGVKLPRQRIQEAYDQAPFNLKVTLDYILTTKLPFYFKNEGERRCYDIYRTGRVQEVETSWLPQDDFVREYRAAMEPVKDAIASTFESWTFYEPGDGRLRSVSKQQAVQEYERAPGTLKVIISWMLATGWNISIGSPLSFEWSKETARDICENLATAHIELHAKNRLAGMY
ncbi:hypothetical protein PENSPDRAFT_655872 [Peniophora sp. CONT]|nr:hypothetical protein PENSPDRAFT_655872 [Peniophora sp. CONT]